MRSIVKKNAVSQIKRQKHLIFIVFLIQSISEVLCMHTWSTHGLLFMSSFSRRNLNYNKAIVRNIFTSVRCLQIHSVYEPPPPG